MYIQVDRVVDEREHGIKLKRQVAKLQRQVRDQCAEYGDVIHELRQTKRTQCVKVASIECENKQLKATIINQSDMVNTLKQELNSVMELHKSESLSLFKNDVHNIQKAIIKLAESEQKWILKRDKAKSSFNLLRNRTMLLKTKRQLFERIEKLKSKLRVKIDTDVLRDTRLQLQISKSNEAHLEARIDMLTENIVEEKLLRGPKWLHLLHKDNRPSPRTPYPWQYVYNSMKVMAVSNVSPSKMANLQKSSFECWADRADVEQMSWGHRITFTRWRQALAFLVLAVCGRLLTKATKKKNWTLMQDGSPIKGVHAEAFVVCTEECTIRMMPWYQWSKSSKHSAECSDQQMRKAQWAWKLWYDNCSPEDQKQMSDAIPLPPGALMSAVINVNSDDAANETAREKFQEEIAGHKFNGGKCFHHGLNKQSDYIRKAGAAVMVKFLGLDRDTKCKEFKTNNVADSAQYQFCKLFGHHPFSYTFGNGTMDFPEYMNDKHKGLWRGMSRVVGSRSLVFMRNALVHYYMAPFYLEWTDYVTKKVGKFNWLHVRTDAKLRSMEVRVNTHTVADT